ncbi:MAG: hypothetical protein IKM58_01310 [Tidjanibacter sp.]|nr:hypothetical protein [Tidjanibacter sp.]
MKSLITRVLVCVLAMLTVCSCGRKEISDKDFVAIFSEMYLVGTYCSQEELNCDSLDIYTPILDKYGYTTEQFTEKLASFTKRKSARVTNVIDKAIDHMHVTTSGYERQLDIRNSINTDLITRFSDTLWHEEHVELERSADSTRVVNKFPARKGDYVLSFNYLIETKENVELSRLAATTRLVTRADDKTHLTTRYSLLEGRNRGVNVVVNVNHDYNGMADLYVRLIDMGNIKGTFKKMEFNDILLIYRPDIETARELLMESVYGYNPVYKAKAGFEGIKTLSPYRIEIFE